MINFRRVGKWIVDHLPEILTVSAVGCVVGGDYLIYRATKKEVEDGDKKHYILPICVSGAGVACIIASNRVSNHQKVSLMAGAAALAAKNMKQRQALEEHLSDEELAAVDELDKCTEGAPSGKTLFYMPDFGIKFWATNEDIDKAETYANKFFDSDGFVSLEDILEFLKVARPDKVFAPEDKVLMKNTIWAFDFESDDEQKLIFERMPTRLLGVDCVRLKIKQFGGRFSTFQ